MSVGVSILFVALILSRGTHQMWCLDGSDCESSDTCGLCDGAACLRVQRNHPQKGVTVAMTCLPHDSLIHQYHPEGCRTELSSGDKLCLCSGRDFCNSSKPMNVLVTTLLLVLPTLFFFSILANDDEF